MFQNIVLCVDGSEQSLDAARSATSIARQSHGRVALVHVLDPVLAAGTFSMVPEANISGDIAFREAEEAQRAILSCAGEVLQGAGVPYETYMECGHPVQRIHHVARETHADLIVIGSRGLSVWPALLLGSVSEGVVRHAPCPVLVIRGEHKEIHKLVIASDGSECAQHALCTGLQLAATLHAEISLLNVFQDMARYQDIPLDDMDPDIYAARIAKRIQQQAVVAEEGVGIVCQFHQESGHPVETIVDFATREDADLIVVGTRGLGGFQRLLLGSVSAGVLHHAHGSVLVVR